MCGRYQLKLTWDRLARLYSLDGSPMPDGPELPAGGWSPRFNIAPTQSVPVVRRAAEGRVLAFARWGFPATWLARQGKSPWSRPLVNARSEEAASKATWRKALRERRCVLPATGFYEWVRRGKQRLPVRIVPRDGELFHFAGLWGIFDGPDGAPLVCASVLTVGASDEMAPVHDRMPVMLDRLNLDRWLDPDSPPEDWSPLLASAPPGTLALRPANTAVNSWKSEGPEVEGADWEPEAEGIPLGPASA